MEITELMQPLAGPRPVGGAPLLTLNVSAGQPLPADGEVDCLLDLNELLVRDPQETFFVRVEGESMRDAGIRSGDLLVVDRRIEARDNHIVIASVNHEFTVKRILRDATGIWLLPENADFSPVNIREFEEFSILGVVTSVIHSYL
jgi:DNA polymerase V